MDYIIVGVGLVGCIFVEWFSVDLVILVIFLEVGGVDMFVWVFMLIGYVKFYMDFVKIW